MRQCAVMKKRRSVSRPHVSIASRIGLMVAGCVSAMFLLIPEQLLWIFGLKDPVVVDIGKELLRYLSISGFFITVALTYTGGLQGTGDTRSPLYITLVSQIAIPIGLCATLQATGHLTSSGVWTAILLGHFTRCVLTVARFKQAKWRTIVVEEVVQRRARHQRPSGVAL